MVDFQAWIIIGVLALMLVPMTYFWYITTKIVPTDSIQLQHLEYIKNPA